MLDVAGFDANFFVLEDANFFAPGEAADDRLREGEAVLLDFVFGMQCSVAQLRQRTCRCAITGKQSSTF